MYDLTYIHCFITLGIFNILFFVIVSQNTFVWHKMANVIFVLVFLISVLIVPNRVTKCTHIIFKHLLYVIYI